MTRYENPWVAPLLTFQWTHQKRWMSWNQDQVLKHSPKRPMQPLGHELSEVPGLHLLGHLPPIGEPQPFHLDGRSTNLAPSLIEATDWWSAFSQRYALKENSQLLPANAYRKRGLLEPLAGAVSTCAKVLGGHVRNKGQGLEAKREPRTLRL